MEALVATALGSVAVQLESGDAELVDDDPPTAESAEVSLPLLVAADQVGARIVAVCNRRPPLMLSDDAGQTWQEAGGGLPAGVSIRESPTRASTGKTTVRTATGGYQIDSFFDIWTEISLDGGQTWSPVLDPTHLELEASPVGK